MDTLERNELNPSLEALREPTSRTQPFLDIASEKPHSDFYDASNQPDQLSKIRAELVKIPGNEQAVVSPSLSKEGLGEISPIDQEAIKAQLTEKIRADVEQFKQEFQLGNGWLDRLTSVMPKVRAFWKNKHVGWLRMGLGLGLTAAVITSAATGAFVWAFGYAAGRALLGFASTFMASQELQLSVERQRQSHSVKEARSDKTKWFWQRGWNAIKAFATDSYDVTKEKSDQFVAHRAKVSIGEILIEEATQSRTSRETSAMSDEVIDRLASVQTERLGNARIAARYMRHARVQFNLEHYSDAQMLEFMVGRVAAQSSVQGIEQTHRTLREDIQSGKRTARLRAGKSLVAASAVGWFGLKGLDQEHLERLAETGKWIANVAYDLRHKTTDTLARFLNWQDQVTDAFQERIASMPGRMTSALTDLKHRLDQPLVGVAEAAPTQVADPLLVVDKAFAQSTNFVDLSKALKRMAAAEYDSPEYVAAVRDTRKILYHQGHVMDGRLSTLLKVHANELANSPTRLRRLLSLKTDFHGVNLLDHVRTDDLASIDGAYNIQRPPTSPFQFEHDGYTNHDSRVLNQTIDATGHGHSYQTPSATHLNQQIQIDQYAPGSYRNVQSLQLDQRIDASRIAPGTYTDQKFEQWQRVLPKSQGVKPTSLRGTVSLMATAGSQTGLATDFDLMGRVQSGLSKAGRLVRSIVGSERTSDLSADQSRALLTAATHSHAFAQSIKYQEHGGQVLDALHQAVEHDQAPAIVAVEAGSHGTTHVTYEIPTGAHEAGQTSTVTMTVDRHGTLLGGKLATNAPEWSRAHPSHDSSTPDDPWFGHDRTSYDTAPVDHQSAPVTPSTPKEPLHVKDVTPRTEPAINRSYVSNGDEQWDQPTGGFRHEEPQEPIQMKVESATPAPAPTPEGVPEPAPAATPYTEVPVQSEPQATPVEQLEPQKPSEIKPVQVVPKSTPSATPTTVPEKPVVPTPSIPTTADPINKPENNSQVTPSI